MPTQLALITTVAQAAEASPPGWTWALVIGVVAAVAAFAWAFAQLRGTQRRLAQLTVEHESTTTAHRELLERERKQAKTLDEKRDEIRDLKRDLASQKKKNHSAQEETKALRKEARDLSDELARVRKQQRPAFAEKPEPARKAEPKPEPEPKRDEQPPVSDNGQTGRITELESQLQSKGDALEKDRAALREARSELKNLRRRIEGLRRIDLVSSGKLEVLEDKLRALGRQYYDAASELAALKGEVKPPKPRDLETESKRDEIADMAASESDDDVVPPTSDTEEARPEPTA